jgi:hypothetical protein
MPLPPGHRANFETLLLAAKSGDLALLDCRERTTGTPLPVLCAANRYGDDSVEFVPLAMLFNDNPYEVIDPPQA